MSTPQRLGYDGRSDLVIATLDSHSIVYGLKITYRSEHCLWNAWWVGG